MLRATPSEDERVIATLPSGFARSVAAIWAAARSFLQYLFPAATIKSNARLVQIFVGLLAVVYVLVFAVAVAVIYELVNTRAENHLVAWAVSGIFVAISVPLPMNDILMHALHYVRPELQKFYIRILWLVPIYSVQSWLALRYYPQRVWFATARELYESFVLWSFYQLMLQYFPSLDELSDELTRHGPTVKPMFPLCCLPRWTLGRPFIQRTSLGILQYVFVRVTLTLITFVLLLAAPTAFGEGEFDNFRAAYVYFVVILNVSQLWAMYCLVFFYHELAPAMARIYPLRKFLSIKAIVFLTFWQSIAVSALSFAGYVPHSVSWSEAEVANGFQDFLICIEMFFFALAHRVCFSYTDFTERIVELDASGKTPQTPIANVALDMLPLEIAIEAGRHVRAGLYGGDRARQVPQPVVAKLVAVDEVESAALPVSPLSARLLSETHNPAAFAPVTVAKEDVRLADHPASHAADANSRTVEMLGGASAESPDLRTISSSGAEPRA